MIFVTVGTQDKPFTRLLEAIDKAIERKEIEDKVIVQCGFTKYSSDNMEILEYIPFDKFGEYIENADVIITHGGVGSIVSAVKKGKKVVAVARLAEHGEHTNNHQLQIIKKMSEDGYIVDGNDLDNIGQTIEEAKKLQVKKYISNTINFIDGLKIEIDKLFEGKK